MTVAQVNLWGKQIGAVSWEEEKQLAFFQYTPEFARSGIEPAPLEMPLSEEIYSFPALARASFHGLPGMLADSLPDKFGNALIDAWLARQGRKPEDFNPVERLCYTGKRGMGALEFEPAQGPSERKSKKVNVEELVELASEILTKHGAFKASLGKVKKQDVLEDILRVGTSAGGARAKAVIAWNPETNEVRSGQIAADKGFTYWILKFDGVRGNKDKETEDAGGFGAIEYAYHLMARAAGIEMTECRLFHENGRSHFMTRRFDRAPSGEKIHMQSLAALAHYDFNQAGAYSYEQAIQVMRRLGLSMDEVEQQFRRAAFNVIARNQDDHVKNIAFLMDKAGKWFLAPAFDVAYGYNPEGAWTGTHQMSLNGKRDHFEREDFVQFAKNASLKRGRGAAILEEVKAAVTKWKEFSAQAGVPEKTAAAIAKTHRKQL